MLFIHYFTPEQVDLPQSFPSPFNNTPHPLAQQAGVILQQRLNNQSRWKHDFLAPNAGKMLGVLVVKDQNNVLGFIAAFSGMLAGQWALPEFVPPVFNPNERDAYLPNGEVKLAKYAKDIFSLEQSVERLALLHELGQLQLQRDQALHALKQEHKTRKLYRHEQRSNNNFFAINESNVQKENLLAELSLQSQFDKRERKQAVGYWQKKQAELKQKVDVFQNEIQKLKIARAQLSSALHRKIFSGYQLINSLGEKKDLAAFFDQGLPPGGTGDCAGPKLIQYAHINGLRPIAMAEFWWGAAPREGIRHHAHYYPACRGKCYPILDFMLKGLVVDDFKIHGDLITDEWPKTVYEDEHLLVVNKPWGLLSVPGKELTDSVQTRLKRRYPQLNGLLLVHRLDYSTSGLLLVAKNASIHKDLQKQFLQRTVEKRYVAVLSKRIEENFGTIELPLRVDLLDRPRQVVCYEHGKAAQTRWELISRHANTTRVYFYPHTGRTHQLRIHAAHEDGLNAPIVGDELYGKSADRLLLHAEHLGFTHPISSERLKFHEPPPF